MSWASGNLAFLADSLHTQRHSQSGRASVIQTFRQADRNEVSDLSSDSSFGQFSP